MLFVCGESSLENQDGCSLPHFAQEDIRIKAIKVIQYGVKQV
jgi:hypothetical protein